MIEPGDIQTLVRELEAQGWKVENTSHSHHKATPPDPTATIVHFKRSGTPGSWKNTLADLRRSGFRLEEVGKKRVGNGSRVHPMIRCPSCGQCTFSAENGRCIAGCSSQTIIDRALVELKKETPEALFAALRDAKELHALAVEETNRAKAELARAQERVNECGRAQETTGSELRAAKKQFDLFFGV